MPLITFAEVRALAPQTIKVAKYSRRASQVLAEEVQAVPEDAKFDAFLSHSYRDATEVDPEALSGTERLFRSLGFSTYVDWKVDTALDRKYATPGTGSVIRKRLINSKSLIYVVSASSTESKWMPWEVGFKDGQSQKNASLGRVAVLPLSTEGGQYSYKGIEYLGMYPFITEERNDKGNKSLWVNQGRTDVYIDLGSWLNGEEPYKR